MKLTYIIPKFLYKLVSSKESDSDSAETNKVNSIFSQFLALFSQPKETTPLSIKERLQNLTRSRLSKTPTSELITEFQQEYLNFKNTPSPIQHEKLKQFISELKTRIPVDFYGNPATQVKKLSASLHQSLENINQESAETEKAEKMLNLIERSKIQLRFIGLRIPEKNPFNEVEEKLLSIKSHSLSTSNLPDIYKQLKELFNFKLERTGKDILESLDETIESKDLTLQQEKVIRLSNSFQLHKTRNTRTLPIYTLDFKGKIFPNQKAQYKAICQALIFQKSSVSNAEGNLLIQEAEKASTFKELHDICALFLELLINNKEFRSEILSNEPLLKSLFSNDKFLSKILSDDRLFNLFLEKAIETTLPEEQKNQREEDSFSANSEPPLTQISAPKIASKVFYSKIQSNENFLKQCLTNDLFCSEIRVEKSLLKCCFKNEKFLSEVFSNEKLLRRLTRNRLFMDQLHLNTEAAKQCLGNEIFLSELLSDRNLLEKYLSSPVFFSEILSDKALFKMFRVKICSSQKLIYELFENKTFLSDRNLIEQCFKMYYVDIELTYNIEHLKKLIAHKEPRSVIISNSKLNNICINNKELRTALLSHEKTLESDDFE